MRSARALHDTTELACIYALQFDDKLAYCDMLRAKWPVVWGGRKDRGDWQDEEPMCLIPINEFVVIPTVQALKEEIV